MKAKIFNPSSFDAWREIDPAGWKEIVVEIQATFFSSIDKQYSALVLAEKKK